MTEGQTRSLPPPLAALRLTLRAADAIRMGSRPQLLAFAAGFHQHRAHFSEGGRNDASLSQGEGVHGLADDALAIDGVANEIDSRRVSHHDDENGISFGSP